MRLSVLLAALAFSLVSSLSAQSYGVSVTPDGQVVSNKNAHTTGHTQVFRIMNEGTGAQTFTITCVGASNVTCLSTSDTVELINGSSFKNFTATYSVGNEGSGQLVFTATGPQSTDQGDIIVPVVLPAGTPRIDPLPYLDAKQDFGRCAAGCFAATYSHSTVPFYSLDAARNVTLVYHGDRLAPKPFVAVNVFPDTTFGSWPSEYQLQVKVNGALVTFTNGEQTLRFNAPTNNSTRWRIGGQFNAATGYTHGQVYPMEILVTGKIGVTFYTNRWITQYLHIDEAKSPIARGWTVAGVQKAFFASGTGVLVTEGDGSATYFRRNPITKKYEAPTGDFSRLDSMPGAVWIRWYPDSSRVKFNTSGLMTSMTSRFGDSTWVTYSSGKVSTIKDHFANTITFAYGTAGLSSITDPTSRVTTVSVTASDSTLSWIQDPDNLKTNFGYDGSKRLLTITARNNKVTTLAYDANSGKVSTITAPSVPVFGGGSSSPVTTFAPWQKLGVPYVATSVTPFPPVRVDTAFARVTEPGAALTRFTVNRWGSPVRTVSPMADGARDSTIVAYTVHGLPARIVRPGYGGSDFDSLAYNGSGLVTYSKAAQATATQFTYGAYAQPLTVATQSQDSVTYFRTSLGKVDSIRVGSATVARYTSYDAFGRPLVMRRPGADTTAYVYFTSGTNRNLNTVTLSGGRTTTYRYDTQGRNVFVGGIIAPTDSVTYGSMNQVTASRKKTVGGTLITTSFQYDSMFNVTQVTDPKGQNYKYRYNALGWLIRQEDPATKRDTMQYSVDADVRRITNRRNLNIDFTYDSLHRAKTRVGTASMSYAYPLNGRRIVGVSPVATDTIFLNVRGQPDSSVTRMAAQRYARRYHYTSAGLPDSLYGYGGVTLTTRGYGWDVAKGVLTGIKLGTSLTSISPDAGLQDSAIVLPGSAGTIGRTFGSLHAPVKITSSQHPPAERWLGFDALGRVSEHLKQGGTSGRFFVYDSLGRYQKAADSSTTGTPPAGCPDLVGGSLLCNNGLTWTFTAGTLAVDTMDLVGNRTSKGGSYSAGTNRITGFDGCSYVTNAAGSDSVRTCGATVTNFAWNAEGQLTSLAVTGKATATFDYDAFGRLVRKQSGGSPAAYFVWDGTNLLAEVGSSGTTVTAEYSYYPGMDRLHAVLVGGTRHYAYADGLGSVLRLGSEAGGLSRTFTYDDWGKITATVDGASLGNKDRARWKGALWFGEETDSLGGLYYMRNRWYEPRTGRFLSEDPMGLAGGINPAVFAGSDPINGVDGLGLCAGTLWATYTYHYDASGNKVLDQVLRVFCVPHATGAGQHVTGIHLTNKAMLAIPACASSVANSIEGDAEADINLSGAPTGFSAITLFGTIFLDANRFAGSDDLQRAALLEHELHHIRREKLVGGLLHKAAYFGDWARKGFRYSEIGEELVGRNVQIDFLTNHSGGTQRVGLCATGR